MTFLSLSKQVELKPYIPREPIPYILATDQEILEGAGGTLIVDTECYSNYFLIAMKDVKTAKVIIMELPFNVQKLSWILHSYTTIGFNYIKYDLPLIWLAYAYSDINKIKHVSDQIIYNNTWPQQLEKDFNFKIWPTKIIDLIEVCPLKGSLKLYGARLHAQRIQDLPFSVNEPLKEWQIPIVKGYCVNDLNLTHLLFDNLTEQLLLRTNLSIEYKQDLMSKSDAQIAEAVISSELKRLTGKWPKKPKIENDYFHNFDVPSNMFFQTKLLQDLLQKIRNIKFSINEFGRLDKIDLQPIHIGNGIYRMGIGGLHSSEENVSYKSNSEYQLYDRDVASFYPAIVLNCKLFPKHLGENFLTVYQNLVDRRLAAKKAKNIAISENLKVTINGTFGKTGSPHSVIYAPEMTIQITVGGQLYLLMLIEALELCAIQVVSANTDGVLVYCHKDQREQMLHIIKWWEKTTGFITEEIEYDAIYSRDVNAYLAIGKDGKTKGKNIYYDPWSSDNPKDKYWRFQKNPNCQICTIAAINFITKQIPIEKTIRECKDITKFVAIKNVASPGAHKEANYLGKVVRWVMSTKSVGTINYIASNNRVPDTEGAYPIMDLEWIDHLNYDWYIDKTIEMLHDMNYLERPKQMRFF